MPILSLGAHYVSEKPRAMAAAWGQMMKHVINQHDTKNKKQERSMKMESGAINYFHSSHTKHQKDLPYKLIILKLLISVPTSH